MKKNVCFFALALLLLIPFVFSKVEIKGLINDYSNILSASEKSEIESVLKSIYDSKKAEYAVVIIDSLEGQDIDSYAWNLAEDNLGDTEKNNGLLLLIAINDRQYKFETGRGLEPDLPDILLGRIGREYLTPNFREDNYGKGILEASKAIQSILIGDTESEYYVNNEPEVNYFPLIVMFIIIFFIILSAVFSAKHPSSKNKKRNDTDYLVAGYVLGSILGGGKGRGGFGGFSGGGFGGFSGGGSFGGGGARGGWGPHY
ncbi:TPM domain-containing protein [Candidatus Woesearchaeota archaeon]|nr:TPM domain-containing protein [Candidatus Woesearchaeota archaeon]